MRPNTAYIVTLSALLTATFTQPAFAYLDPGTGSIVLQAIIGGIVSGFVLIKMKWYQLLSWWKQLTSSSGKDNDK